MDDELRAVLDAMRRESAAAHLETRRHFEILAEDLRPELRLVAEGVSLLTERVERRDAQDAQTATDVDHRLTLLEAASQRR
jgi:light-regulated signal transduction histidine kinase (bacteriophytochrome)